MTTNVRPLQLRLFLEGVEVPVISAQVDAVPDTASTAAIQVVPTDMGLHLLPRTLVHLFYLNEAVDQPGADGGQPRQQQGTEDNTFNTFEALDTQYKVAFTGEVIGFNYGKNVSGRQLVLQCMDLSSYWDACYQWFADFSVGGGGLTDKSHNFVGSGQGVFDNIANGHKTVIDRVINTQPKNPDFQNVKGLLGGIIHLLEVIGGTQGRDGFHGVNDFFTIAELRYRLTAQLGAVEKDVTSQRMYSRKAFRDWLRNGMASMGSLLSFRDILRHVNRYIFHNIYPNPTPFFVADSTTTKRVRQRATVFTDTASGQTAQLAIKILGQKIGNARKQFANAQNAAAAASADQATAGDLFAPGQPDELDRLVGSRINNNRASAVQFFEAGSLGITLSLDQVDQAIELLNNVRTDDVNNVTTKLRGTRSVLDGIRSELPSVGSAASDIGSKSQAFTGRLDMLLADIAKLTGIQQRTQSNRSREVTITEGAHLYTQLILPETFFIAPPVCNVFFPDRYFQFSYSRNFLREVTRLSCRGGLGLLGGGRRGANLRARNYYAPNITDVRGKTLFLTIENGANVILPHEIHSGIVPKFEWVTDGHRWGVKGAAGNRKDAFFKAGKIGFVQRLTNFQYYMHRWSARSMSVSAVFSPRAVLGLPALILDRPAPSPAQVAAIESQLPGNQKFLPTQYLGKISRLSHNVNQGGGTTQISLTHCRTHRGLDDEFMGLLVHEVQNLKSSQCKRTFSPRELLGISARRFILFNEASLNRVLQYLARDDSPKGLALNDKEEIAEVEKSDNTITLQPTEVRALNLLLYADPLEGTLELPEKITLTLKRVRQKGVKTRLRVAVEDTLRPGWYGDIWSNENVGPDVYQQLIGCQSITDSITLDQAAQTDILNRGDATLVASETANLSGSVAGDGTCAGDIEPGQANEVPGSNTILQVVPGSIEEAVDGLTVLYGLLKERGADIHQFIDSFTHRPVATMRDVLGSVDFRFDDNGNPAPDLGSNVVEGFHTRAFGDYNTNVKLPNSEDSQIQAGDGALFALIPGVADPASVTRRGLITTSKRGKEGIQPHLDPRGRARARVLAYVAELELSRGLSY